MTQPGIVVSAGDPCGVGPKLLPALNTTQRPLLIIGDAATAVDIGTTELNCPEPTPLKNPDFVADFKILQPLLKQWQTGRAFLDVGGWCRRRYGWPKFIPGQPGLAAGYVSYLAFRLALNLVNESRQHALITGPVSKYEIAKTIPDFLGHTEVLAEVAGSDVLMCLTNASNLSVVPLTTHIPLSDVSQRLATLDIGIVAEILKSYQGLFNITAEKPVVILGVNPHAGDGGQLGSDETGYMATWAKKFQEAGVPVLGPLSPDGFFADPTFQAKTSVVLGAYHDQVLIPFKLVCGRRGVNMTLGLPFLRVSVDHGPAYDQVKDPDPTSMEMAYMVAEKYLETAS